MQSVTTPTKRPRIMVDMSATLIHHGHIQLFRKAAELGDVVVALTSDAEEGLHAGIKFCRAKRNSRSREVRH